MGGKKKQFSIFVNKKKASYVGNEYIYLLSSLLQKAPVSGVPVPEVARVELAVAIVALVVDRISVPLLPPVREQFRAEQHGAKHRELTKMIRKNLELVMKKMKRCNNCWLNCYPSFELRRYI